MSKESKQRKEMRKKPSMTLKERRLKKNQKRHNKQEHQVFEPTSEMT